MVETVLFDLLVTLVDLFQYFLNVPLLALLLFFHFFPHMLMELVAVLIHEGPKIVPLLVDLQDRESALEEGALVVVLFQYLQCLCAGLVILRGLNLRVPRLDWPF